MDVARYEARIAAIHELGVALDDQLHAQELGAAREEGTIEAFQHCINTFEHVLSSEAPSVLSALRHLHQQAVNRLYVCKGKVDSTKLSLKLAKEKIDEEHKQLQAILDNLPPAT